MGSHGTQGFDSPSLSDVLPFHMQKVFQLYVRVDDTEKLPLEKCVDGYVLLLCLSYYYKDRKLQPGFDKIHVAKVIEVHFQA